jgi:hypothetical protein
MQAGMLGPGLMAGHECERPMHDVLLLRPIAAQVLQCAAEWDWQKKPCQQAIYTRLGGRAPCRRHRAQVELTCGGAPELIDATTIMMEAMEATEVVEVMEAIAAMVAMEAMPFIATSAV